MTDRTAQFQEHRSLLQGIAYRMLGSRADADDIWTSDGGGKVIGAGKVLRGARHDAVITFDTDGTRILAVFVLLNPDKLARLGNEALTDSSKQAYV